MKSSQSQSPLFSRFELKSLELQNRFVMAPMTRQRSPGGVPTEEVIAYYRRRAEHGVGLVITEGTTVDHDVATMSPDVPVFHSEAPLAAWKRVVDEVHEAGGSIIPQLWHVGTARRPGTAPHPELTSVGPSGLVKPGKKKAREMSQADIDDVIAAFAKSAGHAKDLGFDGVELHGAHGYLIDQFFWEGTNQRTDRFGGSLVARTEFAVEIIRAVRAAVGEDFALVLRFSQWKQQDYEVKLAPDPDALEQFLSPLSAAGVDIFHCSTRRFWEPEFEGSKMNLAGWTKKITGKPTITVGSVGLDAEFIGAFGGQGANTTKLDELVERFDAGEFDLVAVGRALLHDPEWVKKVRDGRSDELKAFDSTSLGTLY